MVPDTDVAAVVALPHIAFARCAPSASSSASSAPLPDEEAWLAACRRLTPHVERVAPACALLDLGVCSEDEAIRALHAFYARLYAHGLRVRLGLGATATLAQLALLTAPAGRALAHVPRDEAADFLHSVQVAALAHLHPAGRVTAETVERLHRYGLRTLGHVAQLPGRALRRQFGAAAGTFLAAVARGDDPTPLRPTPAPTWLRFRPRLELPAPPGRVAAALPTVAAHLASALHTASRRARAIRVRVDWERGGVVSTELRLRQPTDEARLLAAELRRALDRLIDGDMRDERDGGNAVAVLRIALGDLAPAGPEQAALWRAGASRRREALARLAGIEDGLARRHGHAVLWTLPVVAPDAIFDEHRYRADGLPTGQEDSRETTASRLAHLTPASTAYMLDTPDDAWRDVPRHLHWW